MSGNVVVGPREIVDGRTFGPGEIVDMDYRLFRNCIFDDCILVYNGGGFGWDGANDFRQRTIRFANDAARVLAFAGRFGLVKEDTGIKLELEVPVEVAELYDKIELDATPFPSPREDKSH